MVCSLSRAHLASDCCASFAKLTPHVDGPASTIDFSAPKLGAQTTESLALDDEPRGFEILYRSCSE
jgi:hypothetical protein